MLNYSCNFRSNEKALRLFFHCMEIFGLTKYNFTTEWKVRKKSIYYIYIFLILEKFYIRTIKWFGFKHLVYFYFILFLSYLGAVRL